MTTEHLLHGLQDGSISETLDTIDWEGEIRLLERLEEKANVLREIQVTD